MDAGLSAINTNNRTARSQVRNQLLSNDYGDFSAGDEQPVMANNQMYQQQQPYWNGPRGNYPGGYGPARQNFQPQRRPRTPAGQPSGGKYSLQAGGITNLWKFRQGKSRAGGGGSGGRDSDDDEEIYVADADSSLVTFNDISSLRNNGGHKYGLGGAMDDTSPIIPTVLTTKHDNMTSTEYRKHLANQKKMAFSALSKQATAPMGGPGVNAGPRTMSLQSSHNSYQPFARQQMPPVMDPNYGRANSMMSGRPPQMRPMNYQGYGPPPANGPPPGNGPRAMSLTNARRPAMQPTGPPQNYSKFNAPPYPNNRNPVPQNMRNVANAPNKAYNMPGGRMPNIYIGQESAPATSSSLDSTNSFNSAPHLEETPGSQFADDAVAIEPEKPIGGEKFLQNYAPGSDLPSAPRVNVLKLSDQQQSLANEHLNDTFDSKKKWSQPYEQRPTVQGRQYSEDHRDFDRRSSSSLGNAMKRISLNESPQLLSQQQRASARERRQEKTQSTSTFMSSLSSESPLKKKGTSSGLYKLENGTDANAYFTASEFPSNNESHDDYDANVSDVTIKDGQQGGTSNRSEETFNSRRDANNDQDKPKKLGKARNFLKRLSSRQSRSEDIPEDELSFAEVTSSRKSSAGSMIQAKVNSSGSSKPYEPKIETAQKRRSFHSLFSNSSLGNLHAIESTEVRGLSKNSSEKSFGINQEHFNSDAAERPMEVHLSQSVDDQQNVEHRDLESQIRESAEDDFNFDNSVNQPYKPLYASASELSPILEQKVPGAKFKTVYISGSQIGIIQENVQLIGELELLSKELAESIAREASLEERIANSTETLSTPQGLTLADFEKELRKKSSKVVELIQALNDERLKRFIAEEQVLLQENGAKPNALDLVYKIDQLNRNAKDKDREIEALKLKLESLS
ncbi:LAMI_0G00254g1_1 [Lachancea mirantina]|uniref:LAMI_0G00254g1_1 n=1 Tax=Lachancea mirantina TaxID=1230905 RepID=A0A1G4K718_9SACH|nr:LAMI_0G00254g1_1 [Lachancea mirantina]